MRYNGLFEEAQRASELHFCTEATAGLVMDMKCSGLRGTVSLQARVAAGVAARGGQSCAVLASSGQRGNFTSALASTSARVLLPPKEKVKFITTEASEESSVGYSALRIKELFLYKNGEMEMLK